MWFLFGGVTLIVWICVEFWRRHLFRWSPDGTRDGLEYNYTTNKGKVTSVKVGLNCPAGITFSIKRQSAIDTLFKKLRVSSEFESGDLEFDDLCYVISDYQELQNLLVSAKEFRHSIKQIFSMEFPARASSLHCRGGRLWVVLSPTTDGNEQSLKSLTLTLKPNLSAINRQLESLPEYKRSSWKDPFVIKAVILLAINSGMAINGVVQLVRITWSHFPVTYDVWPLFWDALTYGLVGMACLVVFGLYWLGRSARTHLVLIELLTIGILGAVANVYVELRDRNMELDTNPPVWNKTELVAKNVRKGRKGGKSYYLVTTDWHGQGGRYRVKVSRDLYCQLPRKGTIQMLEHKGALGYRWISDAAPTRRDQERECY